MGWLGAALAFRLAAGGVEFTWNDTEAPVAAWRASTGIVYPAGDVRSQANLTGWGVWYRQGLFPPGAVAEAAYCFAHRNPPHKGNYPVTDLGWLRVADAPCFAVDVPTIVRAARERFAQQRRDTAPGGTRRVIAHGFGPRRDRYVWGWSARVTLQVPAELQERAGGRRLAFYGRPHRFQLAYAYPIPTEPGRWWAGSSLVAQRSPRPGDPARAFDTWRQTLPSLYPKLTLTEWQPPVVGWRPRGRDDDPLDLRQHPDGTVEFPPLWHSGIRWAPQLVEAAATRLGAA